MNTFNNSGNVGGESVETLVKEASHKLEIALEETKKNGRGNGSAASNPEPITATTPANDFDDYDPDDLAAAFFANQARQRNSEHKLRVDEWATTIVSHNHHHRDNNNNNSSSNIRRGSFETMDFASTTAPMDEALVEQFYEAFQNGLVAETTKE